MSIDRTAIITGKIEFSTIETASLSRISDVGNVGADASIPHPVVLESGDFNAVYHYADTLPSGGSFLVDLSNLTMQIFGDTVQFAMTTVKGICVEARPETSGYLNIATTGSSMWSDPWGGQQVSGVPVYDSWISSNNNGNGWEIGSGTKLLLKDSGMGIPFSICVVGSSG